MKSSRYVRSVSALERYSLVLNNLYRYHVDGILEGEGQVDADALQAAVSLAAAANPAIRVRFRGLLIWSRWVDSGVAPKVRLLPMADWDGKSEQGAEFLQQRLDNRGAVADVLLVPCSDGKTRIVFRTLHAAIDGRGFLHWVSEVCRALRGEPLQGSSSRLTDLDIQARYADEIPEEPAAAPSHCIPVLQPASSDARGQLAYVWRRVVVNKVVPQLLPRTAVFLAEWARQHQSGDVGFTIPVDYRGLRTDEMGLGNLTGYVRITVPEGATPRQLMVQLGQRLKAKADCRQFPGIRTLLWLPVWFMLRQLKPKVDSILHEVSTALPTGGIVSMGNVSADTYSFHGFKAQMLYGIPGAVGKLNVVFLNYPDFTVISFSAPSSYNQAGQLDDLVAAFAHHLLASGMSL